MKHEGLFIRDSKNDYEKYGYFTDENDMLGSIAVSLAKIAAICDDFRDDYEQHHEMVDSRMYDIYTSIDKLTEKIDKMNDQLESLQSIVSIADMMYQKG